MQAFLDAGEPQVYVGYGSLAGRNPRGLARTALEALQREGVCGTVVTVATRSC